MCVTSVARTVRGTKELTSTECSTGILYKSYRTEFNCNSHRRASDTTGNLRKAQTFINLFCERRFIYWKKNRQAHKITYHSVGRHFCEIYWSLFPNICLYGKNAWNVKAVGYFSVLCTVTSVLCTVTSVLCTITSVLCTVTSVLCSYFCLMYNYSCLMYSYFCLMYSYFYLMYNYFCLMYSYFCLMYSYFCLQTGFRTLRLQLKVMS